MSTANSSPICIYVNGRALTLPAAATVRQLLRQLNLPERGVAIEVDGRIVPKGQWDLFRLDDGARMELVHMVGGGA